MKSLMRIIKFVLLFVLFLVLIGISITSIYGEKIEQFILKNIREKSLAEIAVKDVNFSVFENFPYGSVKLTEVLILEKQPNQKDTLLYVNQGYLQFNIFNLISRNREISKIVLLDSRLNIKYDMHGNPNFKIFKQEEQKEEKARQKEETQASHTQAQQQQFQWEQHKLKFTPEQLTIDHVLPRSLGGATSWDNVVAACYRCNLSKGSDLIRPSNPPHEPSYWEMVSIAKSMPLRIPDPQWQDYLQWPNQLVHVIDLKAA